MANAPGSVSGPRLTIAAALILAGGAAAGAAALYVGRATDGNASASRCQANAAMQSAIAANATGEVAAMRALDVPVSVDDLDFEGRDGSPTSLGAMAGRPLLVNFWATWCPPCRAEMPMLQALHESEGGDGFAVVPISLDQGSAAEPLAFYDSEALDRLPFFHDADSDIFDALKRDGLAVGMPVTLIVDAEGCARGAMNGPAHWSSPDAVNLIRAVKTARPTA